MVTLEVREDSDALAATAIDTSLAPVPLLGESTIQLAGDVAVHRHPAAVETLTVALAPALPNESDVGDTVT